MEKKISVVILTKNEERDLPGCLQSLDWSDDIYVFDSLSSDRTAEIAEEYGAKVVERPFDNWSSHQNWGLTNIPFKHEWVYYCDADERVTPQLAEAMLVAVNNAGNAAAFRVQRRDYYLGSWLKNVTASPFNIRLFRPEKIRYEREVNPITIVDGETHDISAHFDHFSFSKGFDHWFAKHNSYSALEAKQIILNRQNNAKWSLLGAFFEKDKNKRRFNQKELFYKIPCRPLFKFFILYFGRMGFLDGYPGFSYAVLQSIYEYMIVLKTRELEQPDLNSTKK